MVVAGKVEPEAFLVKEQGRVSLGKGGACDVRVSGWLVGSPQCYVVAKGGKHYLVHHKGWRPTTVNGRKLRGHHVLRQGDVIGIGACQLRFE